MYLFKHDQYFDQNTKWLKGLKLNNRAGENLEICQLLYADDTVIFCETKAEQSSYIRVICHWFVCELTRAKAVYFLSRKLHRCVLANILGCRIDQIPTVYLGMTLGNKHKDLKYGMG
ncbi:hypothetical protein H5410_026032 [Solanum commersonii]|uniref:Uncharacterized protein n=1 Tax=Solanum commersonii TaxID=4109 RepID=A0A9J5YZN4_SOLCO|nr:hypothetical protein H5410_026032 [Solanum commersonii]